MYWMVLRFGASVCVCTALAHAFPLRRYTLADTLAVVTMLLLFPIAVLYVAGCDRLKGGRR